MNLRFNGKLKATGALVATALAVLAVFDPLRRRLQEPVDRFFFREVYDARRAVEEVSAAVVER